MANQALIKRMNRARIMNALRLRSPISRSELADSLGLDRKSLTNIVFELLEEALVEEVGQTRQGRGRPRTLLELRRDTVSVLGVAIHEVGVDGVVADLYGAPRCSASASFSLGADFGVIKNALSRVVGELCESADPSPQRAGLVVPGIIDCGTGLVHRSVNLRALDGVNVREQFQAILDVPLAIEEASRAKALAEMWFGLAGDVSSFVCVDVGVGIGAGIVQDRRLYAGASGYAGEIGHVVVEPNGRRCTCGHLGCLEAYVSDRVLLERIEEATGKASARLSKVDPSDSRVRQILEDAGHRLGLGLSTLVNILCPPLIVVNGALMGFSDIVMRGVEKGLSEGALPACSERVRICPSGLTHAAPLGAVAKALADFYEVDGHVYV
ncbi:MAG: ROK family protein [Lentisphaeria bacterium]|nr:ROK family protein [Lentisphaeria bacterium]